MEKKTLAAIAVKEFETSGRIPNLEQKTSEETGVGVVHVFPDGSLAAHWEDGDFTEAEIYLDTP